MPRRSKDIGTEGETAVKRYANTNGFPLAVRRVLAGSADEGDLTLSPGAIAEVKWGKAAETAGPGLIADWMDETEVERRNAGADVAVLIVKRKGVGVDRVGLCHAWLWSDVLAELLDDVARIEPDAPVFPVRMTVADAFDLLRWAGFGEPLPQVRAA